MKIHHLLIVLLFWATVTTISVVSAHPFDALPVETPPLEASPITTPPVEAPLGEAPSVD